MTHHEAQITNPEQKQFTIIGDLKVINKDISCIIETVNRIEDYHGLRKLEFKVTKIHPLEYLKNVIKLDSS